MLLNSIDCMYLCTAFKSRYSVLHIEYGFCVAMNYITKHHIVHITTLYNSINLHNFVLAILAGLQF